MIFEVVFPIPLFTAYDYAFTPDGNEQDEASFVGRRVLVPFGFKRKAVGIVCRVKESSEAPPFKLKSVLRVLDPEPLLPSFMMKFGQWLCDRYACSLGEALFSMFPPGGLSRTFIDNKDHFAEERDGHFNWDVPFQLTEPQKEAIRVLHEAVYAPSSPPEKSPPQDLEGTPSRSFLLLGVAAAGKTEVFMSAIRDVLLQGRTALYLVPEIGLATQTMETLKDRFGHHKVAFWHSGQREKDRRELWWKIRNGQVSLVVGPRSAALLPLPHLGVIVMDEEQDLSYKEEQKPRFQTRDVVFERARIEGALAIFGTATPSLELLRKVHQGEVRLIEIQERVSASSRPNVRVVDLKEEKPRGILSPSLKSAIEEKVKNHQQVILFLNRRGFHRYVICPRCDWVARCPRCEIALVVHKGGKRKKKNPVPPAEQAETAAADPQPKNTPDIDMSSALICHYCASKYDAPPECPKCGQKKLFSGGYGTQRASDEIQEEMPWARVVRWDRDAAERGGDHQQIYDRLKKESFDVLIGTQVVAQGFNFPNVTLVGVLDADVSLFNPDFRAAERTFQILTQVAGRAGRELITGDVVIQTRHKDHYALQHALSMDIHRFADVELKFRDDLRYPPYTHLARVVCFSKNPKQSQKDMEEFLNWMTALPTASPVGVLGPTPPRHFKQKKGALQVVCKIDPADLSLFLSALKEFLRGRENRFWLDIDPEQLF